MAWHGAPVGIDIEWVEHCDAAFATLVCTGEERSAAARTADRDTYLTSLWSAKEALAKALGNAVFYEPSRLASPLDWPQGRAGPWRAQELAAPPGHVAWLCWRSSASPGADTGRAVPMGPVR